MDHAFEGPLITRLRVEIADLLGLVQSCADDLLQRDAIRRVALIVSTIGMRFLRCCLILIAGVLTIDDVWAHNCRQDLLARANDATPPSYSVRAGGEYCDGNVPLPNSGEVELVSLTIGTVEYGADAETLKVGPTGTSSSNAVYRLQGLDKRPGKSYRLDGRLGPNGLEVNLRSAIKPIGIKAADLGLVAWRETTAGREYVPLLAGTGSSNLSGTISVFRTPIPLVQLVGQVCDRLSGTCASQQILGVQLPAGSLSEVRLPLADTASLVEVKITSVEATGASYAASFTVALPPRH